MITTRRADGVNVGVRVGEGVSVGVAVSVAVAVRVGVAVGVAVSVALGEAVGSRKDNPGPAGSWQASRSSSEQSNRDVFLRDAFMDWFSLLRGTTDDLIDFCL
jgi:hypothetical protein